MQTDLTQNKLLSAFILHYDGLVSYVQRHFGSHNFAADVVHDVCIRLIEDPPIYEVGTPLAFFRKASVNRAIDRSRHEKICLNYAQSFHDTDEIHYLDGASAMEFSQKIEQVKSIIQNLPNRQRQVFLLHQLHGVTQQQIALEMGITPNMVTKHFNKAISNIALAWQQFSK
ncbi:MAG: RNA polymerase sigma factor [Methylophilaceae bacterium]